MTLISCIYVPTGIVLSGDSRTSTDNLIVSDATNKVFLLYNRFGVATSGGAYINRLPIEHYVREFEINNKNEDFPSTEIFVNRFLDHIKSFVAEGAFIGFTIARYDETEPFVYRVHTRIEGLHRLNFEDNEICYGIYRDGDTEIVNRLFTSKEFIPWFDVMNLQDAIDFSRHLIRTTIDQLRFEPRFPTVGGPIDTLLIGPKGNSKFVAKKDLTFS